MRTLTLGFLSLNFPPAGNAPPDDVVDAAAAAGFRSVGLRITGRRPEDPYVSIVSNDKAIGALKNRLAAKGLRLSTITGYGFFPDLSLDDHVRVLDATARLGCDLIVLNVYYEDQNAFADALGALCVRAASFKIRVGVEFMPFSGLRTLCASQSAIERSGAKNVGHIIDALHLMRSGGTPADVANLDKSRIFLGQLCDAPSRAVRPSDDELRAEARSHRLYPGDGNAPLMELLDTLPPDLEIEIEVPRPDQTMLLLADRAKIAGASLDMHMRRFAEHQKRR
jgi:sugar phosphate isomerase/epimerase